MKDLGLVLRTGGHRIKEPGRMTGIRKANRLISAEINIRLIRVGRVEGRTDQATTVQYVGYSSLGLFASRVEARDLDKLSNIIF
jgi:hypothetical protein